MSEKNKVKKPASPIPESRIIEALEASGGFVSVAAKKLNCTVQAIYFRIRNSEKLRQVKEAIDESYLDLTESKLITLIKNENLGAICFFLKCKGRGRGWIEHAPERPKDDSEAQPLPLTDYRNASK